MNAIAADGEELNYEARGQTWRVSWHPPASPPPGKSHGSVGLCVTPHAEVVLVSADGETWDLPAGRPEAGEEWRSTLDREVQEEACAAVEAARLLGFSRGVCVSGPEQGLVLVRAIWRAEVSLAPWEPLHETGHRLVLPPDAALTRLVANGFPPAFWRRLFREAATYAT